MNKDNITKKLFEDKEVFASFINGVQGIAERLLSPKEYSQFQELHGQRQKEFLAGRFAAREAIVKALPIPVAYSEIEVNPKDVIHYQGYQI